MTMKTPIFHCAAALLVTGFGITAAAVSAPAAAQMGGIVHDPRNYAQNILSAARTLEQINNQIKQLQNQATSLANEARNLSGLPVSTLEELQGQVDRTSALLGPGFATTCAAVAAPAAAQMGGIVHYPRNDAQNIRRAARTLEQSNKQIKQRQNQATSLANEARNLSGLPVSTLEELQGQVDRTRALLGEAQRVAFDVGDIQKAFDARYKGGALTGTQAEMVANAEARWNDSVGAFQDAMKVQAGVVGNM